MREESKCAGGGGVEGGGEREPGACWKRRSSRGRWAARASTLWAAPDEGKGKPLLPLLKPLARSFFSRPTCARARTEVSRAIARASRTPVPGLRAQTCGSSLGASGLRPLGAVAGVATGRGEASPGQGPIPLSDAPLVCVSFSESLIHYQAHCMMVSAVDLRRTPGNPTSVNLNPLVLFKSTVH